MHLIINISKNNFTPSPPVYGAKRRKSRLNDALGTPNHVRICLKTIRNTPGNNFTHFTDLMRNYQILAFQIPLEISVGTLCGKVFKGSQEGSLETNKVG